MGFASQADCETGGWQYYDTAWEIKDNDNDNDNDNDLGDNGNIMTQLVRQQT